MSAFSVLGLANRDPNDIHTGTFATAVFPKSSPFSFESSPIHSQLPSAEEA